MSGRDQEGHVVAAAAVADHPDGDGIERFEEAAEDAGGLGDLVADDGDDRMVVFDPDGTEGFQFAEDVFQFGGKVHQDRSGPSK